MEKSEIVELITETLTEYENSIPPDELADVIYERLTEEGAFKPEDPYDNASWDKTDW